MAESTKNKAKTTPKKGSTGKKKSTGENDSRPAKKKKHSGKTVEMQGDQITVDEVITQNQTDKPSSGKPRHRKHTEESPAPDPEVVIQLDEEKNDGENEQVVWGKQISSIAFWLLSVILLALTTFPGESGWTYAHNFILGILGFKAFLWAFLLIFSGYLYARQYDGDRIREIIQTTAALIFLTDILCYILFQSNGYRDVFNELSFGFLSLMGQVYHDGSKFGGTGMLGGFFGEILMFIVGKNGALIIVTLLIIAVVMLLTHTGPVALFDDLVRIIRALGDPETYRRLARRMQPEKEEEDLDIFPEPAESYDEGESFMPYEEESFVPYEEDAEYLPAPENEDSPPDDEMAEENSADHPGEEPATPALQSKKRARVSKSEEIRAQRDELERQIDKNGSLQSDGEKPYRFPPLNLLIPPERNTQTLDDSERETMEATLLAALDEHRIKATITEINAGPTVTRFEITPASGVRINQITSRSKDIALRLAAKSIRIEAPIPGKSAVGIEIPNKVKKMVRISEILGSREFREAKGSLIAALGKDLEGNNVLCDLSKMVHLLIAGSTGSGKSVCINTILISLLYKYSPEDVKMILIDPKSVEFDMYNGIPHLLVPVVCDPKKAAGALQWAVSEMEKRYQMLKEHGVRNIDNYNHAAETKGEFKKLSRIVIVIDEMADLMLTTPKEVEDSISRLAAKARAAGMHLVFATQRPSVEVITGTIKNNIPSRIALAVSSNVDSRTILDEGGAENLIGNGDMLFHPANSSKHTRVQGCFVDDEEVDRVISFVKQNGPAEYDDSIADEIERNSRGDTDNANPDFDDRDECFERAVEIVTEAGQASVSMLQRRLSVGYARAGRIVDQLEKYGIVGPSEGSKPRAVLITRAQWLEMSMAQNRPENRREDSSPRSAVRETERNPVQFYDSDYDEYEPDFDNADHPEEASHAADDSAVIADTEPQSDSGELSADPAETPSGDSRSVSGDDEKQPDSAAALESDESRRPLPRDFSLFFDDDTEDDAVGPDAPTGDVGEDDSDLSDVPGAEESASGQDNPSDIPPWEDSLFSYSDSESTEDQTEIRPSVPQDDWSTGRSDRGEDARPDISSGSNDTDDDEDDDILFSPWIKRL
jgi:DNA segregation ATPase FtsK/SpoIIIE and related proteins